MERTVTIAKTILQSTLLLLALALPAQAAVGVGDEPPDYLGKDAHGDKVLISEHRGKLVVVSFFASWCGPCRKEVPVLARLQQLAHDQIIVVTVNYKEDREVVRQLRRSLKDYGLTITHDANGSIGDKYGVNGIPHMIIVGKDGKIAAKHVGYGEGSVHTIVDEINRLWREPETFKPETLNQETTAP